MQTIFESKEQTVIDAPLLVFDCLLPDGRTEQWSTHQVTVDGAKYSARVLSHNIFEMQTASDQGVDGIPRISIVLANADSHFSEIERAIGWKGARLTVGFLFYDLRKDTAATERSVIFQGTCNPPDEIREGTLRITASNRMNLQRLVLPQVRIQRRCAWEFPQTEAQRTEAVDGGGSGKYSRFYRCGYSAGLAGGSGTLNADAPFTACGYTRGDCTARGMFAHFGGIEFVPSAISVRTYGDKSWHPSAISVNEARYNDFVPLVYGTAWYAPPVVFARTDGNLTRMEVLLGIGEMSGVVKVLVNDVEIPAGVAGTNMTGTGWYNIPTLGARAGVCNPDFTDGSGQPAGDPYGSMAYASVVVPNRLNDGTSLPRVRVLVQGLKVPIYGGDGSPAGEQFSSNPAWILLDILRRTGWSAAEIDVASFATAAALCDEQIAAIDANGNAISLPRFACNVALQNRRSAGDVVRGIRNTARLLLSYGANGMLQLRMENTIAGEQPVKPAWSNSREPLDGGWPSYEFGDGTDGFSGIVRRGTGEPTMRVFSRSMADTPNRFAVEFQDALNEYQQDGFSLVDPDDVARCGQEVSATLSAIGIANYDQAGRLLKVALDKSVHGNTYIEFETTVKAFGIRPGDLIAVTYLKEGFSRQVFRVLKIAPGTNHRITRITAQIHADSWYVDSNGQSSSAAGGRRMGTAGTGVPRPLMGSELDGRGAVQFGVTESATTAGDGRVETSVAVAFVSPTVAGAPGPGIPLLSLSASVAAGGTLKAGETFYYGITGVDENGNEGALSFLVRASVIGDGSSVTLGGLSFAAGTTAFNVYRGTTSADLCRVASEQALAAQFTDNGLPIQLTPVPDSNFDHANFYWRMEVQPEVAVTAHSTNTIANSTLGMALNRYRGATARITSGKGAGQERTIAANSGTTSTVTTAWDVEPDATSFFAVAESGWKFGALAQGSPVQFTIPNLPGETVHLTGRAANVNDIESSSELAVVTRWQIGGSAAAGDSGVPASPFFGLSAGTRGGTVELSAVSFSDLTNTRTISAGTVTLYYRDELSGSSGTLANAMGSSETSLTLSAAGTIANGNYLLIEGEVMRVEEVQDGTQCSVTRGLHGTTVDDHAVQTAVYGLKMKTAIAPFPAEFFGSPYSGSWSFSIPLADARVASAEMFVTNSKGNGATGSISLTHNDEYGLRTLSGGQYCIQISGFLAVEQSAAPPLIVETPHAVKDVYAVMGKVADADVQLQLNVDGAPYCTVTIPAGATVSTAADGARLAPLLAGAKITLSILSVGRAIPGADLSVLIRL
jgi:Putative phage tail protein